MFAPAATPRPIVEKLHASVTADLTCADQKEGFAKQMMSVAISALAQEFTDLVRRETRSWGEFLREARIKVEWCLARAGD